MEIQLLSDINGLVATLGFCLFGFLGILGGIASTIGSMIFKKEKDPLLGLASALFGGASKKAQSKADYKRFMQRMKEIKPGKSYSGGVDPVVEAAIGNIFASRGMQNPYANKASAGAKTSNRVPGGRILNRLRQRRRVMR
jgi:hypothetical protein